MSFQSALPLRGATRANFKRSLFETISIRAPLAGSDAARRRPRCKAYHFNPRSPCGERRPELLGYHPPVDISIRAPLAGSDNPISYRTRCTAISIRAPLAGSDAKQHLLRTQTGHISIRAPLAGSDIKRTSIFPCQLISIRAPLAGSDKQRLLRTQAGYISIRAPLAGSDARLTAKQSACKNFNPRSPCGERHARATIIIWRRDFNPRSPCGERRTPWVTFSLKEYFNPRSPCGERPLHFVASIYYQQSVVFSKTVTANSVDKLRKTTAKSAITRCEPHS